MDSTHMAICRSHLFRGVRTLPHVALWLVLLTASLALLDAQGETIVEVPAGRYSFAEAVPKNGTATNWIRYRPAVPGSVTIRGGELRSREYVILDGFIIDGRLDPDWPAKSRGINVIASHHITVTNSEIIGPADIHTGFGIDGTPNCKEAENYPTQSGAVSTGTDTDEITFSNIVAHGFYAAGTLRGNRDRLVNSLFRNNFNGLSFESAKNVEILDSVFWVHPNHLFAFKGVATVRMVNNLLVDGQDMIQAGGDRAGVDELHLIHNTFWIPANKPCYSFSGVNLLNLHRSAFIRDNILVSKDDSFISGSDVSVLLIQSDYNLFYNYFSNTDEFGIIGATEVRLTLEQWRSRTGQDLHSIIRQAPQFVDPPRYEDFSANQWGFRIPSSAAEARSWLTLRSGSPGKGAGSDGLDMGITGGTLKSPPSAPSNLRIIR